MFFLVFYSCSRSVSIPPGSHITFWPDKFLKDVYDWTQEVINTAREHLCLYWILYMHLEVLCQAHK